MRKAGIIGILLMLPIWVSLGQSRQLAFQYIEQPSFTRLSGLGGVNLTNQSDVLFFLQNPASLTAENEKRLSFHYLNFPGGINWGTAGYQWTPNFGGQLAVGLQFVSYGKFEGFDQFGIGTGDFSAQEFNLQSSYARTKGIFTYGASIKFLGSLLDSYQAYAMAFDFGVMYQHPSEDLRAGLTVRNVGFTMGAYLPDQELRLPQDVRLGISFKPKYMPIRFSWTLRNLNNIEQIPDATEESGNSAFEKMVWAAEILPSENFNLFVGYNQLVRKQFEGSNGAGAAGFSAGFAFRVKRFELSYSRAFYNVAGGSNLFGVSTSFNQKREF